MRFCDKRSLAALAAVIALGTAVPAQAKTIGVYFDARTRNIRGLTNSLVRAGWKVELIDQKAKPKLKDDKFLDSLDVLMFSNGHQGYFFPENGRGGHELRLPIVRAAARGLGVLSAGFRNGWVRTSNRPMFPEFGVFYNRVNGPWMTAEPDTPFTAAFGGRALSLSGHDHLVMKPGPWGRVFARSKEDITGTYGDYYFGRVVVFGGHFLYNPGDAGEKDCERVLLSFLDWLKRSNHPSEAEAKSAMAKATAALERRDVIYDWTLDARGPDRTEGLLPMLRDDLVSIPESQALKLRYYVKFLPSADAERCEAASAKVLGEVAAVKKGVNDEIERLKARLDKAPEAELHGFFTGETKPVDLDALGKRFAAMIPEADTAGVSALVEEMLPKVRAAKTAAIEREYREDLKAVPELVNRLRTGDATARYEAALELGRLSPEDGAAVEALVKALEDDCEEVRTQAAITLGWMRAKKAVKPLAKRLRDSSSVWDRRRAAQALGAIGEASAAGELARAFEKDSDAEVRKLALLGLGWLKAKDEVPRLIAVVEDAAAELELRECAALALGYIGDARAEATLVKRSLDAKTGKSVKPQNLYTPDAIHGDRHTLAQSCLYALELLRKGGRKVPGIVQDPDARSKAVFYALTKGCNALAGRLGEHRSSKAFGGVDGQRRLLAYLVDAGFTGVHNAWGQCNFEKEDFARLVEEADDLGLLWIDVMPRDLRGRKSGYEPSLERFAGTTAWTGYWREETWPVVEMKNAEMKAFLERRFGSGYEKRLTAAEKAALDDPETKFRPWLYDAKTFRPTGGRLDDMKQEREMFAEPFDGILRTAMLEACGDRLAEEWKENQDFLRGRRKGCAATYSMSTAAPNCYIGGSRAFEKFDVFGAESYQCFGRGSAFLMQKYRNGRARAAMSEYYHWYCPSNVHALRGFWQNMIHGKCFYNFALQQIFEQPSPNYLWLWEEGRWAAAKSVFGRVRDNAEWYSVAPTKVNIAVIGSERSVSSCRDQVYYQVSYLVRHDENLLAVWTSLNESHLPADILYAESMTAAKLAKYDVLYLANARMLSDEECALLREWVRAGGTLITEGTTSLFDPYRPKKVLANYRLADVFGVDYERTLFKEDGDSIAWRPLSPTAFPLPTGLSQPWHFDDWVHRDMKPVKSVITAKDADGLAFECDAMLGYDRVKPTTAKVLATFPNGDAAVLENGFGKGRCYFQTALYPQLAVTTGEWEMMPSRFDFWPGVREELEKLVRAGLAAKGVREAVSFDSLPLSVEVTPEDRGAFMTVHLLDYELKSFKVAGTVMTVNGARKVKRAFYPDTRTEAKTDGNRVTLRDFNTYDLIVIEFEP